MSLKDLFLFLRKILYVLVISFYSTQMSNSFSQNPLSRDCAMFTPTIGFISD